MARTALHADKLINKALWTIDPVVPETRRLVWHVEGREDKHADLEKENLIHTKIELIPTSRLGPCVFPWSPKRGHGIKTGVTTERPDLANKLELARSGK